MEKAPPFFVILVAFLYFISAGLTFSLGVRQILLFLDKPKESQTG